MTYGEEAVSFRASSPYVITAWGRPLNHPRQSAPQVVESPPGEDQWYVRVDNQNYGPLRFSHLRELVEQKRVLEDDWIWQAGLDSWVAAADVTGLFADPARSLDEPRRAGRRTGEKIESRGSKAGFKERTKGQVKDFALMFLYLWIVFGFLVIHESIVLSQHQINFAAHGLAFINALVFAKVMLIAEDLHLGHRFHDKPLIYSIIFKSVLFAIALISFHVIEHVIIGMWHGQTIAESIVEIRVNRLSGIVSLGIIGAVALAPFFILSEISRAIGSDNFRALFFRRRSA
jgi:hypothetical protein